MADDIVTRLHDCGNNCDCHAMSFYECVCAGVEWPNSTLNIEAADEIERLRAAGDALALASTLDLCDCSNEDCMALRDAHRTWTEARS